MTSHQTFIICFDFIRVRDSRIPLLHDEFLQDEDFEDESVYAEGGEVAGLGVVRWQGGWVHYYL